MKKVIWYEAADHTYGKKTGRAMLALNAADPDNGPTRMTVDARNTTDEQLRGIAKVMGWEVESIDRHET